MSRCVLGRSICFLALAVFLFPILLPGMARATEINIEDGAFLDFSVTRDGNRIGAHSMKFSRSADRLTVDIKTDVAVTLGFIPLYHFNHEGQEIWQGDQLSKLVARTDDDGTMHDLVLERSGATLKIEGDGNHSTAPAATIPASLWHPGLTRPGPATILNTLDGHLMAVNIAYANEEEISVQSGTVLAKHFVITGELERELWYDPQGLLAKARFKGSDGSLIEYVLK